MSITLPCYNVMMPPEIIEMIRTVALQLFLCNYETLEFLCVLDLDTLFGRHVHACACLCVCVCVGFSSFNIRFQAITSYLVVNNF